MSYVMVLADGETYTDLDQCQILFIEDRVADEDIDSVVKARAAVNINRAFFTDDEGEGVTMTLHSGVEVSFS